MLLLGMVCEAQFSPRKLLSSKYMSRYYHCASLHSGLWFQTMLPESYNNIMLKCPPVYKYRCHYEVPVTNKQLYNCVWWWNKCKIITYFCSIPFVRDLIRLALSLYMVTNFYVTKSIMIILTLWAVSYC